MKNILHILAILGLCLLGGFFISYMMTFILPLIWAYIFIPKKLKSFVLGFMGAFISWLLVLIIADFRNNHVLFPQVAAEMGAGNSILLSMITAVIGGILAGLGCWLGSELRALTPRILKSKTKDFT